MTDVCNFVERYASFLKGYAEARLGPARHERGRRRIHVDVCPGDDYIFTVKGYFEGKPEIREGAPSLFPKIELAPIHISRKDVEDNRAPEVLDERLPLWRAAADAPMLKFPEGAP